MCDKKGRPRQGGRKDGGRPEWDRGQAEQTDDDENWWDAKDHHAANTNHLRWEASQAAVAIGRDDTDLLRGTGMAAGRAAGRDWGIRHWNDGANPIDACMEDARIPLDGGEPTVWREKYHQFWGEGDTTEGTSDLPRDAQPLSHRGEGQWASRKTLDAMRRTQWRQAVINTAWRESGYAPLLWAINELRRINRGPAVEKVWREAWRLVLDEVKQRDLTPPMRGRPVVRSADRPDHTERDHQADETHTLGALEVVKNWPDGYRPIPPLPPQRFHWDWQHEGGRVERYHLSTPPQEFPVSPTESCRPVGRLRRAHHG